MPVPDTINSSLAQHARLTHALNTCIQALGKILKKPYGDWVNREVIFGSEEFKIGMEALKEACDALGYILELHGWEDADAKNE